MRPSEDENDNRTVFCGNLSEDVTDQILFELFNQAGPVEIVRRPKDPNGRPKSFGFVVYKHECSVPYALELFRGTKLFNKNLNLNSRSTLTHNPVLNTHLTEFTEEINKIAEENNRNFQGNYNARHRESGHKYQDNDHRRHRNRELENERGRNHSNKGSDLQYADERNPKEPSSWAELNALRGKGSHSNSYFREDLQGPSGHKNRSNNEFTIPMIPDFNALLQMGQQIRLPMMGLPGMMPMGLGPNLGGGSFPSMQGKLNGGDRSMPPGERGRRDYYQEERSSRRSHPYSDHHRDDHRRHDRGYSCSKSSHDRERRDRRSR